jgi:hypothetical protein
MIWIAATHGSCARPIWLRGVSLCRHHGGGRSLGAGEVVLLWRYSVATGHTWQ